MKIYRNNQLVADTKATIKTTSPDRQPELVEGYTITAKVKLDQETAAKLRNFALLPTEAQIEAVLKQVAALGQTITRAEAITFIQNTMAQVEVDQLKGKGQVLPAPPLGAGGATTPTFKQRMKKLQNKK